MYAHDSRGRPVMTGGEAPKDPERAGFVGKRRKVVGGVPDASGNRAERRAWAKAMRRGIK